LNEETVLSTSTALPVSRNVLLTVRTTESVSVNSLEKDRRHTDRGWKGSISELIIYDRPLSEQEMEQVEEYLRRKWRIALPFSPSYRHWIMKFSHLTTTNELADPDLDGLPNWAEFALGRDPETPDQAVPIRICTDASGQPLVLFLRRKDARYLGIRYILDTSTNLLESSWTNAADQPLGTQTLNESFEWVTNAPARPEQSEFFRLRLEMEK
jgi:hypothetical protein